MRKLFLSVCMFLSLITFARQKEWMDPAVNAINRAPARAAYFAYPSAEMAMTGVREGSNRTACGFLSGRF